MINKKRADKKKQKSVEPQHFAESIRQAQNKADAFKHGTEVCETIFFLHDGVFVFLNEFLNEFCDCKCPVLAHRTSWS